MSAQPLERDVGRTSKQHGSFLEYAAFKMMLSVCARMNDSERRHLLMWFRKLMTGTDRKSRLRLADRIVNLYGRPRGFGRRLRHILFERNISVAQFAENLGTTAKHLSKWLAGDSSPNRDYRLRVAHVLGLDDEELSDADRDSIAG